jgi:hypothetical protein
MQNRIRRVPAPDRRLLFLINVLATSVVRPLAWPITRGRYRATRRGLAAPGDPPP